MWPGAHRLYPDSVVLTEPGQAHRYQLTTYRINVINTFIDRGASRDLPTGCLQQTPTPPLDLG
jgi:hypothetical protein